MTKEISFCVGEIVSYGEKRSPLFRRDAVVVCVDLDMFGVISDGLPGIYFFENEDGFQRITGGTGQLDAAQLALLAEALQGWEPTKAMMGFPKLVEEEMESLVGSSDLGSASIALTAEVPRELIKAWRETHAIMELARQMNPKLVKDVNQLMVKWAMLAVFKVVPAVMVSRMLRKQS